MADSGLQAVFHVSFRIKVVYILTMYRISWTNDILISVGASLQSTILRLSVDMTH